jgi:benzoylformate decarboxylase
MANFPNSDFHWQGELPGDQKQTQQRLADHDVAFLCGFGAQAQLVIFKYSDGPLIPDSVEQVYLHNNTWELGKNHFGDAAILGDIKATLPNLIKQIQKKPPAGAQARNGKLKQYATNRTAAWAKYLNMVHDAKPINAAVVAHALGDLLREEKLDKKFVYVHEAVSDSAPFQYYLPLSEPYAEPTSYYSVEGGSLGWSMPATLGIKLAQHGHQGIDAELVINAVGDGSALFYPQVWWTAAKLSFPILYLVINNQEYRTLLQGLEVAVNYYHSDPDYGWGPVTSQPDYLKLQKPPIDFVALAKVFGVLAGRRVSESRHVKSALQDGLTYVRKRRQPYVIDFFTESDTKAAAPVIGPAAQAARAVAAVGGPPPLDLFYYRGDSTRSRDPNSMASAIT